MVPPKLVMAFAITVIGFSKTQLGLLVILGLATIVVIMVMAHVLKLDVTVKPSLQITVATDTKLALMLEIMEDLQLWGMVAVMVIQLVVIARN